MTKSSPLDELERVSPCEADKIAIADCVIEWARAESQLRALLTAIEGRSLDQGAVDYSRLSPEDAWKRIKRKLVEQSASSDVVDAVQNNRENSRKHYDIRKHVVHSGLVGRRREDPEYLAFAPFESDTPGEMLFLWIPVQDIVASSIFARSTSQMANRILTSLEH